MPYYLIFSRTRKDQSNRWHLCPNYVPWTVERAARAFCVWLEEQFPTQHFRAIKYVPAKKRG